MKIGEREIGNGKTFVIAEAALEHGGSVYNALRLIDAAAEAGADAVKFQTFRADELGAPHLADYELAPEAWSHIVARAQRRGITFFSTPFDCASVDLLDPLVPCFKIASGEITNERLLRHVASKGKPVILSTGMADMREIREALRWLLPEILPLVILHCVSAYPAPIRDTNLRAMTALRQRTGIYHVGLSDHSEGSKVAEWAVALGASVIEKHLTLPDGGGPDHHMSLKPQEFARMVKAIREVESALGDGRKRVMKSEEETRRRARRDPATGKRPA